MPLLATCSLASSLTTMAAPRGEAFHDSTRTASSTAQDRFPAVANARLNAACPLDRASLTAGAHPGSTTALRGDPGEATPDPARNGGALSRGTGSNGSGDRRSALS